MDTHLGLLGRGFPYGRLPGDDAAAMMRTIFVLLRDTGRRTHESPACAETAWNASTTTTA